MFFSASKADVGFGDWISGFPSEPCSRLGVLGLGVWFIELAMSGGCVLVWECITATVEALPLTKNTHSRRDIQRYPERRSFIFSAWGGVRLLFAEETFSVPVALFSMVFLNPKP